jgi:hypothetical protein
VISNNDSFACHQCLESCFPFNNLNNPDFLQTIENSTSEIDMNRINNLVFDPFKSLNNSETENLDESAINPVIENSYYTTNTFNNLIETKNIASNNLSQLHLNKKSKIQTPAARSTWQLCVLHQATPHKSGHRSQLN